MLCLDASIAAKRSLVVAVGRRRFPHKHIKIGLQRHGATLAVFPIGFRLAQERSAVAKRPPKLWCLVPWASSSLVRDGRRTQAVGAGQTVA